MSFQAKELIFYALDKNTIWSKTGVEGGGRSKISSVQTPVEWYLNSKVLIKESE